MRTVREWIAAWGAEVAAVDIAAARRRFSPDVVSFGTYAEVVHGLDELAAQQWANVWPAIAGFSFRVDELTVIASADRCQAVAVVPWDSVGISVDGPRSPDPVAPRWCCGETRRPRRGSACTPTSPSFHPTG